MSCYALTWGRIDNFSNILADHGNFFLGGCYLFRVLNSGLLFSNGRPSQQLFPPVTVNFDLWSWPSNLTNIVSRWTSTPKYLVLKVVVRSHIHAGPIVRPGPLKLSVNMEFSVKWTFLRSNMSDISDSRRGDEFSRTQAVVIVTRWKITVV